MGFNLHYLASCGLLASIASGSAQQPEPPASSAVTNAFPSTVSRQPSTSSFSAAESGIRPLTSDHGVSLFSASSLVNDFVPRTSDFVPPAAFPAGDSTFGIRRSTFESPPPSVVGTPPSPYTPVTPMLMPSGPPAVPASSAEPGPLKLGPFRVIPSLNYRVSYSTGLPDGRFGSADETTIQHTVAPSIAFVSKHLTFSYSPTLNYYAKGRYEDSRNHLAFLRSSFGYGDWRFGLNHSYATGSQVLAETAAQTDTESHNTGITAAYQLTPKTSFELSASQAINNISGTFGGAALNNSRTWSTMNWVNYQLTEITRLGVGLGGGYSDVTLGSDMSYEQIQGRIGWDPRPKLSIDLNGGAELRQFLAENGAGDRLSPIMGASASYRPFEQTTLSLSANRGISASLFADQITETTSISAGIDQRFLERFQVGLNGGIRLVDYQTSSSLLQADRSDEITFISASLGTRLFKKGSISISYSHSTNNSNLEQFTYDTDTFGVQLGYTF